MKFKIYKLILKYNLYQDYFTHAVYSPSVHWLLLCIGETPIYMYTCKDLILPENFKLLFKLDIKAI